MPPPPVAPAVAAAFLLVLCQPLTLAADVGRGGGGGDEGMQSVTLPGQIVLGESRTFFMWRRRERKGQETTSARYYTPRGPGGQTDYEIGREHFVIRP